MLTTDDVHQIARLLDARFQAEREYTRQIVREETQAVEQQLTQTVKATETRLVQKMQVMQIDIVKTITAFFHEIGRMLDNHEHRIKQLEQHHLS